VTLTPGSKLGPYEITASLGAGGMGEVYRARDTRLGRDVAVKVLPAAFATDPERRARFETEARTVAGLSHPNVLALHDIGIEGEMAYVVMELIEGETLRERLIGGAMPASRAIPIAVQVARGLGAAHDKGVVHRDLKPENIMITADGFAKILDFGLARRALPLEASSQSLAPTVAASTEPGTVLGTTGYMAPEQVRGLVADARSDLFAFGAVLFEMLAGRRAFAGDSPADTMTAILREETPELVALAPEVPPAIARIVGRCLEKNPAARFRSAADLAFALEAVGSSSSTSNASGAYAAVAASQPRFKRLSYRNGYVAHARFVPGSTDVVFGASWQGRPFEIFSARPGSPEARSLGLPAGSVLSVSAQGDLALSVGFRHEYWNCISGTLSRVPIAGGGVRALQKDVGAADWTPDGRTLALTRTVEGRVRLEYPAGQARAESPGWLSQPRVAPDGKQVAFARHDIRGDSAGDVCLWDEAHGERTLHSRMTSISGVAWSADGEEVWFSGIDDTQQNGLWAKRMGGAVREIMTSATRFTLHDIARDGRVLVGLGSFRFGMYHGTDGVAPETDLTWFDGTAPGALMPEESMILFWEGHEAENPHYGSFLRGLDGSPAVRLGDGIATAISPDRQWIVALTITPRGIALYPTGLGESRHLSFPDLKAIDWAGFRPDGSHLLVVATGTDGRRLREVDPATGAMRVLWDHEIVAGLEGIAVSRDGERMVLRLPSRELVLFTLTDGSTRSIPGLRAEDVPIRFDSTERYLFVAMPGSGISTIERIDCESGERVVWRTLRPADSTGVAYIGGIVLAEDARSYAYASFRNVSDLYVVENLA
jgi:serine/threonine protein kinase